jgi:hypothetical protein
MDCECEKVEEKGEVEEEGMEEEWRRRGDLEEDLR